MKISTTIYGTIPKKEQELVNTLNAMQEVQPLRLPKFQNCKQKKKPSKLSKEFRLGLNLQYNIKGQLIDIY